MTDKPDKTIATITKNSRDEIRVLLRSFKGKDFVDIRLFTDNGERETIPTKTGISIRPDLLIEVIKGLQAAELAARAAGLI